MKRAVAMHWNTHAEVIERALYLHLAIDKLLSLSKYDKCGKKGLQQYKLEPLEWRILTQLEHILGAFLAATVCVSKSKVPLLHEVIPLIDSCTGILEDAIADLTNHQAVHVAAARGLNVLNKYYSKTDDSIMYHIAMIMHPRYKL
ncbi:hypothetical protein QCA50_016672 [Cerrena zonata]|uniref:Uncharacterized protein n=1 Tax=Cerrena zonata TaxID=2478898 RepID=A0AAW0FRM0_9APHY